MISIKLKNVDKELALLKRNVAKEAKNKLPKICENMVEELKSATPVDTGLAKSKWEVIRTGNPEFPVSVQNTVKYIESLNAGSSKQAPAFFVDKIALKYGKPVGIVAEVTPSPDS